VPWRHEHATARWTLPIDELGPDDAWYGPWPPFHVSGKLGVYVSALIGGRLVIREGFSTRNFWPDVRKFGATATIIVAATTTYLWSQPESSDDRNHTLRHVYAIPPHPGFADRFGLRLCQAFNMTEVSSPIATGWDENPPGSCGRLRPGAQARIVDEHDQEVPTGEVGELVIRMDGPDEIMAGYWNAPEATAAAWRNQWFHTGDAVRCDENGYYYFVDRLKDTIRRRGESISSLELETEIGTYPGVRECAAVGVPSEWGEHDVKIFVVPESGMPFDPQKLFDYLSGLLPSFMLPRYISVLDELPMTHTHKTRKVQLREITGPPAWERAQ
jgi:crotonobetaine/carnitine-CoA ligase